MDQKPKKVTNNRFGQSILTNTRKKYHKEWGKVKGTGGQWNKNKIHER